MRILLVAFSIFLVSCAGFKDGAKSEKDLKGSSWTLVSITNFELETTPKPVTLNFSDSGTVNGNAGCNLYGGDYTVEEGKLSFGQMLATKMACMPGLKTENEFFHVLSTTDRFAIEKKQLILMQGDRVLATFSKQKNK